MVSKDSAVRNARVPVALVVLPAACRPALLTLPVFIPLGNGEPRAVDRGPEATVEAGPRGDDVDDIADLRESGLIAYFYI